MPPLADTNNNGQHGSAFDYRSFLPTQYMPMNTSKAPVPHSAMDDPEVSTSWWNTSLNSNVSSTSDTQEESWCCTDLSFRERMLGFGTCLIAGYMLSFGSFWRIRDLVIGNPYPLVLHTMVGNLLTWAGSFFLVGPKTQWNRLWHAKRKLATQVYLASLALMLLTILLHPPGPEGLYLFVMIIVQNGAMAWYCLSYIPFAHETIRGYASRLASSAGSDGMDLSYVQAPV